ncbi:MAG: IS21 family transposase [Chloroflexi bacterium]|nr:IS21 family transposase [Chloroflexota bacterium]
MLRGGSVKSIYELHGEGKSIRQIARLLQVSRNSVRKYLRAPGIPVAKSRPGRARVLEPYEGHLRQRLSEGVENAVVLLREIRALGYQGGYSTVKAYLQPLRRAREEPLTTRYETEPGEQAQVDLGCFRYHSADGKMRRVWAFVMVLSWSRAIYVEFLPQVDTATFIHCHLNAMEHFGGMVERYLYDNTKLVVLGREADGEVQFNARFLDFGLRLGFTITLCKPYRAQTKGRVESGVKYVRHNFWPSARFTDVADLNQQARTWCAAVADVRVHGTTFEQPAVRLEQERLVLRALPGRERLLPFLREERIVGRDNYVRWERACYGVPGNWAHKSVQVQANEEIVEIWDGSQRLAVHPRASRPGQHLKALGQWALVTAHSNPPSREALAYELPTVEVERRPLSFYEPTGRGW